MDEWTNGRTTDGRRGMCRSNMMSSSRIYSISSASELCLIQDRGASELCLIQDRGAAELCLIQDRGATELCLIQDRGAAELAIPYTLC